MRIRFGVLGPVIAETPRGEPVALKGPMHRAVLARLLIARGRVVPVPVLVADLWVAPPEGAVAAVRTFVAALRRAVEPGRLPRAPASLLTTEGPGYALRAEAGDVDAWRFEEVVTAPSVSLAQLDEALGWWRGPAYAELIDATWTRAERARLTELRLMAVERRAQARLDLGRAAEAVPDLDEHVTEHPWREDGWRLLALALYRAGRQADALAVLRRARELLAGQLGLEPGAALRELETGILRQAPELDPAGDVWSRAASAYDQLSGGSRVRLESAVGLLRNLAVTGPDGLAVARAQRAAAVAAAEQLGDPALTARVIGAYDVPAIWTRSDDPEQAAGIVAAAGRALAALPASSAASPAVSPAASSFVSSAASPVRARLLATVAVESRGSRDAWPLSCAQQALAMARELDDPGLLAFALNGTFMQSCRRCGGSGERDRIGASLVALARRHGLITMEVLGHLIRIQAGAAVAGWPAADRHAETVDELARQHELPLVGVFTQWYRAVRADVVADFVDAYRVAADRSDRAGMPGLSDGLLSLALLGARMRRGLPVVDRGEWGPYEPWVRPVLSPGSVPLELVPDPPADLLAEALWTLLGHAGFLVGDRRAMTRAADALAPAAGEWAGAASGLLTFGPVTDHLRRWASRLTGS